MTTEPSQGTSLNALPVSPAASSGTPGILTPLSTSSSDPPVDSAPRRPQPNNPQAPGIRADLHRPEDDDQPSTALLAHDGYRSSPIRGNGEEDAKGQDSDNDDIGEGSDMAAPERPPMHRPTGGRSEVPLLKEERGRPSYESPAGSARPAFAARRSTFRSRSPDFDAKTATRKKYLYAGFFLLVSLVSFVVQTETASYIQIELGWNKAYCML